MDATDQHPLGMNGTLHHNIAALAERHRREAETAPWSDRVAARITDFAGSMAFVVLHVVLYSLWILVNLGAIPGVPRFDPTFVVLAMEASVEAIFLSTFVLVTQNRMAAAADRRADLDLHINLLAEHELTRLAALVDRIADHLGVPVADPEVRESARDVAPSDVLDAIDKSEPDPDEA
jgi:uncharacterized membrane protein